jgi:hypothetical protein
MQGFARVPNSLQRAVSPQRAAVAARPALPTPRHLMRSACACGGNCPRCSVAAAATLQPKLSVNEPGDVYEREADRVADQVMRMPDAVLQKQCTGCPDASAGPNDQEKPRIQRLANGGAGSGEAASDFTSRLGAGAPLDTTSRGYFEPRFGHDFGDVRVHNGPQADRAAAGVQARAFTLGRDVVFAAGEYDPGSVGGKHLLAHELTHVVQQSGDTSGIVQREPACGTSTPDTAVDVFFVTLPGATGSASADIARANVIWQQCSKQINMVGGETWQTNVLDVEAPAGILNAPASTVRPLTAEETQMSAHRPGGDAIHAYYVPDFTGPKVAESFWPTQHGQSSVIVGNNARTDSFAHELGHVLLNSGNHETDPDNLMASGSIRNVGVDKLECPQCK